MNFLPYYQTASAAWWAKLTVWWACWLVWPLLFWMLWRMRRWRALTRGDKLAWAVRLAVVLLFIEARFVEPAMIVTRTTTLSLGFSARVAVISDVHLGVYKSPLFLERAVERLNALEVDAVLIAGDFTYEPDRPLVELLAPLKNLKHRAYSVPGNHDESSPGPPLREPLRAALAELGVRPVEYGHADLGAFRLVGLGDRFAGRDAPDALRKVPRDKPVVVLVHNPDTVMHLRPGEAALAIAGHTHGGQMRVPWLYRKVIPCLHPFDRGLHDFAPIPTFVTAGLGEIGLPMRFLNPPVIDVLDIRK